MSWDAVFDPILGVLKGFGPYLFVFGASCDILGARRLARGLTTTPRKAAWAMVTGRNTFDRFSVRDAEDYADGKIGLALLYLGFVALAVGYESQAAFGRSFGHSAASGVAVLLIAAFPFIVVPPLERRILPTLRDNWLIAMAHFDRDGKEYELPSAPELFAYGQLLDLPAEADEWGDPVAYVRRVFGVESRDPTSRSPTLPTTRATSSAGRDYKDRDHKECESYRGLSDHNYADTPQRPFGGRARRLLDSRRPCSGSS